MPITIHIAEIPLRPSITLIPSYPVYTKGESVTVTCSPPTDVSAKIIQIYQEEKKIYKKESMQSIVYPISTSTNQASGKYSCKYWVEIDGRKISSSQSTYVTVSITEVPPAPSIILTPSYPVYTKGESVTLTCSPPTDATTKIIQIYQEEKKIHEKKSMQSVVYPISTSTNQASGKYYCKYWVEIHGREISSSRSADVTVSITEIPPAPSITLTPSYPVYTKGESVTVTCLPPTEISASIQIYQEEKKIHEKESMQSIVYPISTSTNQASGKYSCKYWVEMYGRKISSSQSADVTVSITEIPPAPYIILTPPYPVYTKEESVTLTCSPPTEVSAKVIQIYQEGKKIHEEKSMQSVVYPISTSTNQASGKYSCKYWVEISRREISSSQSADVTVSITEIPPAPSITLTPSYPVYTKGESVTVTCSPPTEISASIQIYQEEKKIHEEESMQSIVYPISTSTNQASSSGKYSCKYWVEIDGRKISSSQSTYVTVSITEIPPAPYITLTPPYPVYTKEESVTLTCSPPTEVSAKVIQIYQEGKKIHEEKSMQSVVYPISTSTNQASGKYYCKYWVEISRREISSSQSADVTVSITEIPSSPSISLKPSFTVYTREETVTVVCNTDQQGVKLYQFFKNNNISGNKSENLLVTSGPDTAGSYSCSYVTMHSGREIESKRSAPIDIKVIDIPSAPSIISEPEFPVYLRGETINMTCSPPRGLKVTEIQYFKDDRNIFTHDSSETRYRIDNSSPENAGKYSCGFSIINSGRQIHSKRSSYNVVSVVDPPGAPALELALNHQLYVVGETLQMSCVADSVASKDIKACNIYKHGKFLRECDSRKSPNRPVVYNDNGNYTCSYFIEEQGRKVESLTSLPIAIHVIDRLPAPNLTLSSVVKMNNGFKVTLNCSAPDPHLMRHFFYIKTSNEHSERNVTDYSASLMWELGPVSHADFYCLYEEEMRGRKIKSKMSHILTIPLAGYKEKRFRLSWYWKTNKKVSGPRIPKDSGNKENNDCDLEQSNEVSRCPSHLSIVTAQEDNEGDVTVNFSTFHRQSRASKALSAGRGNLDSSFL
ncbi:basement membrane-specific heparan sulfate proteoglycan core protein-like isoform X2 [Hyperolius riggenbachi]|uniref:basement membrane-specific heparan sulfate proteoglycan core protein-like isoform X2 n=1 Tax=Hyperolius riggenbachi TaxID=752182 RepID=UPI0035A349AA